MYGGEGPVVAESGLPPAELPLLLPGRNCNVTGSRVLRKLEGLYAESPPKVCMRARRRSLNRDAEPNLAPVDDSFRESLLSIAPEML